MLNLFILYMVIIIFDWLFVVKVIGKNFALKVVVVDKWHFTTLKGNIDLEVVKLVP